MSNISSIPNSIIYVSKLRVVSNGESESIIKLMKVVPTLPHYHSAWQWSGFEPNLHTTNWRVLSFLIFKFTSFLVFDATGKLGAGLYKGNVFMLGSYDDCIGTLSGSHYCMMENVKIKQYMFNGAINDQYHVCFSVNNVFYFSKSYFE